MTAQHSDAVSSDPARSRPWSRSLPRSRSRSPELPPYSRLRGIDVLPQAAQSLRTRPARAALSILGIAIGIAAIVAVLGITRSSQADLLARIDRLGTNLLTVANGQSLTGEPCVAPEGTIVDRLGLDVRAERHALCELITHKG